MKENNEKPFLIYFIAIPACDGKMELIGKQGSLKI
jgi:hypothetical protein